MKNRESVPARASISETMLEIWAEKRARNLLVIAGSSMLPLIRDGDSVLVEHGVAGIRRGDIVVFHYGNGLAAHRVLRVHHGDAGTTFSSKGDHTFQFDPPLGADEIVGRVLAVERAGRYLSLDTLPWRVLGWLIAVSTLAGAQVYGWVRALEKRVLGPRSHRGTTFLRQSARVAFSLTLKGAQAVLGRWKDGNDPKLSSDRRIR